jgi:MerR-like DNA binding protein
MVMTDREPEIDAAAVARLTGVSVGTLNVWISRGLVPDTTLSGQGRSRLFNETQARHIAIMTALVRLGYPAPSASNATWQARNGWDQPGARLIIGPPRVLPGRRLGSSPTVDFVIAESAEALDRVLDAFTDGAPEVYTVVKVDKLVERVRKFVNDPDVMEKAERGIARKWAKARRALLEPQPATEPAIPEPTER